MTNATSDDLATQIGANLPYLRRYARALTGSQSAGDTYAAATLETILADQGSFDTGLGAKAALFKVFHSVWSSTGAAFDEPATTRERQAQKYLSELTTDTREALLLHTIEEFPIEQVAGIMGTSQDEARSLIDIAYQEMARAMTGKVMIIEDEAIIAVDLEAIVSDMNHRVTGIGRTESGATDLAAKEKPDLILSDIQLADGSSGIDAVNRILEQHGDIPVIFITAYPERLLTGEGPEPAFLISKPYTEQQVRSAVSQAMFFASTETLKA